MAAGSGATLTIAHVWQPAFSTGDIPVSFEVSQAIVDEATRLLSAMNDDAKKAGVKNVSTVLLTGSPWAALSHLLEEKHAYDLVVMGTHGRTGLKHVLLGSVAEKVVRHAPCAVLVIR